MLWSSACKIYFFIHHLEDIVLMCLIVLVQAIQQTYQTFIFHFLPHIDLLIMLIIGINKILESFHTFFACFCILVKHGNQFLPISPWWIVIEQDVRNIIDNITVLTSVFYGTLDKQVIIFIIQVKDNIYCIILMFIEIRQGRRIVIE